MTGEKILYRDGGDYKIVPGASISRVKEMLDDIDKKLANSASLSEHACITLYCIWYNATCFLQECGAA